MADDFTILRLVSGWRAPIDFQLLADDDPINLAASSVQLQLYEASGAIFNFSGALSILDASSGLVRFTPALGDIRTEAPKRVLSARFKVTTGGEVVFFPSGEIPDQWIIARPTLGTVALAASPMDPDTGDVRIYAGDDYDADDSFRALEWSSDSWPNLTGATLTTTVRRTDTDAEVFSLTSGAVELGLVNAGQATQTVRVLLLPRAKTVLLTNYGRNYKADVEATLANGDKVELVDARVIAAQKQTRQ